MRRNSKKRHSVRRNSKRRGSRRRVSKNRYVLVNGRRVRRNKHRRMRRNMTIMGIDPVTQVLMPGGWAIGGLMLANGLGNAVAAMDSVRNVLDAGKTPEQAVITKTLVDGIAGLALLAGVGKGKLPGIVSKNIAPIVAGMGCAAFIRILRTWAPASVPYLGRGFGEYVSQPMGAYVTDPSMGEYVNQPMGEYVQSGMGAMYALAGDGVDGQMDVMEAAAGVGAFEAAAGMGLQYAAAGMGADSAVNVNTNGPQLPQPPFVSIEQPLDLAAQVTAQDPRTREVPEQDYAREDSGRRKGRGIFAGSLFEPSF